MKLKFYRENCATEPFLLLYWFAKGIHSSILPQLMMKKVCLKSYNATICSSLDSGVYKYQETLIENKTANWNTVIFLAVTVSSIFQVVGYGITSDIVPRKLTLLLPPLAMSLQSFIYIMSSKFINLSIGLLVFGATVTCPYGDTQGAILLAFSYLADVTSKDRHRTFRMAILESCILIGHAIGSYLAGHLLKRFDFVFTLSVSLGVNILNFFYVALILPTTKSNVEYENPDESVTIGHCRKCLNYVKLILHQAPGRLKSFIFQLSCARQGKILIPLLLAIFFTNLALRGENEIIIMFLKHSPLNLSSTETGNYIFLSNIARGFGVIVVAVVAVKAFKALDFTLAIIGVGSLFLTHVSMGVSRRSVVLYFLTPVSICVPLSLSTFRVIITKYASAKEYGTALALVAVINYFGSLVTIFCVKDFYQATVSFYSGATMLLLASFTSVAFFITLILLVTTKFTNKGKNSATVTEMKEVESDPLLDARNENRVEE